MPVFTNADVLDAMRQLAPAGTGRLRGQPVAYTRHDPIDRILGATPQPWRSRIADDLAHRHHGILTPQSAEYLALSDNVLIAVLTVAARIELPDYPLTSLQRRHQAAVVAALSDLPRTTLRELADQRAGMDHREEQTTFEYQPPSQAAVRTAASTDPTVTEWVAVSDDLDDSRDMVRAVGLDPNQLLIISAPGYGRYGNHRHRLDLPTLCAMCRLAATHQVSLTVVGDWLDAEGATHAEPSLDQITSAFTKSYLGSFTDELTYTRHHIAQRGWMKALDEAGIPEKYLDLRLINADVFSRDVRQVTGSGGSGIAVFRRTPTASPPPAGPCAMT